MSSDSELIHLISTIREVAGGEMSRQDTCRLSLSSLLPVDQSVSTYCMYKPISEYLLYV